MNNYILEYSPEAVSDLDDIFDDVFTASARLEITRNYIEELQDKIDALLKRPKSGTPLYYNDMFTGYYTVRYKEYLVFYRLEDNKMLVDRILFRRRDYLKILFRREE